VRASTATCTATYVVPDRAAPSGIHSRVWLVAPSSVRRCLETPSLSPCLRVTVGASLMCACGFVRRVSRLIYRARRATAWKNNGRRDASVQFEFPASSSTACTVCRTHGPRSTVNIISRQIQWLKFLMWRPYEHAYEVSDETRAVCVHDTSSRSRQTLVTQFLQETTKRAAVLCLNAESRFTVSCARESRCVPQRRRWWYSAAHRSPCCARAPNAKSPQNRKLIPYPRRTALVYEYQYAYDL
jgi:hypothetical protein